MSERSQRRGCWLCGAARSCFCQELISKVHRRCSVWCQVETLELPEDLSTALLMQQCGREKNWKKENKIPAHIIWREREKQDAGEGDDVMERRRFSLKKKIVFLECAKAEKIRLIIHRRCNLVWLVVTDLFCFLSTYGQSDTPHNCCRTQITVSYLLLIHLTSLHNV